MIENDRHPSEQRGPRRLALVWLLLAALALPGQGIQSIERTAERDLDWQYYADAQQGYETLLRLRQDKACLNETLGYLRWRQGDLPGARRCFEAELALAPANSAARMLWAILELQAGNRPLAGDLVDSIEGRTSRAERRRFQRAHPQVKKFIADNPGLQQFVRGVLLLDEGLWEEAGRMLRLAREKGYEAGDVELQLIDLAQRQGDPPGEIAAVTRLLGLNAQLGEQLNDLLKAGDPGGIHALARSRPIVVRYCRHPLPEVVNQLNGIALNAFKRGEFAGAVFAWQKALTLNEHSFFLHFNLALAHHLGGRTAESLAHCRRAVELGRDDNRARAFNLAGLIQERLGQIEPARDCFRQAVHLAPRRMLYRNNLGHTLFQTGDLVGAEREWRKVLGRSKDAKASAGTRESAEGGQILVAVTVREDSDRRIAARSLAVLYLKQGRDAPARPLLEQAVSSNPGDADAHFELGRLLLRQGDPPAARRHLEQAIERGTAFEGQAKTLLSDLAKEP